MHKTFIAIGSALAGLGVILGAFAAHKLKEIVPEYVGTFQTGVQYQMYHAFALIFTGILFEKFSSKSFEWAGISFLIGIILFSGSLYLLTALKATETVGLKGIGIITPIGGLFFIVGWILFVVSIFKK